MRAGLGRGLHLGEEVAGRAVMVAWVVASVASWVERVGWLYGLVSPPSSLPSFRRGQVNSGPGHAGALGVVDPALMTHFYGNSGCTRPEKQEIQ